MVLLSFKSWVKIVVKLILALSKLSLNLWETSLISFSIERDVVPGRMGMLIIIYLMQINTYNSVQAPPNRGFSMIETWFVGIQIPILFAILQYGIILTLKKYWPDQKKINLHNANTIHSCVIFAI